MKKVLTSLSMIVAVLAVAPDIGAQANDTCTAGSYCVDASNNASDGPSLRASCTDPDQGCLLSQNYGNGAALVGFAGSGNGVYGFSSSGNGVVGQNTRTDLNGAAISGLAGSDSGLAYWGTGSMELTGGLCVGGSCGAVKGVGNFTVGLQVAGTCRFGSCTSDERLKKNIRSVTGSLEVLARLRPVTFEWKNPEEHGGKTGAQRGFIAQEVEKVVPEWVGVNDKGFKTLDMVGIEPLLVDGIRSLKAENDNLRDRVKALEAIQRPLRTSLLDNTLGLGMLGVAVAGVFVASRRKREPT